MESDLREKVLDLREEILNLRRDMETLLKEVRELKYICSRMDNHINFVENVYTAVRQPFSFILGYTTKWTSKKELPMLSSGASLSPKGVESEVLKDQ